MDFKYSLNDQLSGRQPYIKAGEISIVDPCVIQAKQNRPNKGVDGKNTQASEAAYKVKASSEDKQKTTHDYKAHIAGEACFVIWMNSMCPSLEGQHIAVDGKCVLGLHDGQQSAIHLVSAWISASGLTLGQVRTADNSNEITAIPDLLATLDIKGAIITIDAMGCQHDIATKIVVSDTDYVLGVKDNPPGLAEAVKLWFDAADSGNMDRPFWDHIQTEKNHGWIETQRCVVTNDVAWLAQQNQHWSGLQSLIMIKSTREIIGRNSTGTASVERRYYISSLPAKAALLGQTVRAHWGIETVCTGCWTPHFAMTKQHKISPS